MGSVGDESHDAVAKELTEECLDFKTEVLEGEGLATEDGQQAHKTEVHEAEVQEADVHEAEVLEADVPEVEVQEADVHEAEVLEVDVHDAEGLATQNPTGIQEAHEAEVQEAEFHKADVHEAEFHKADIHEAEGLATQNPTGVLEAEKAEVQEAEVHEAEVREAEVQEAEVLEAEVQEAEVREAEVRGAEVRETDVHEAEVLATQNPTGVQQAHEADVHKAEADKAEVHEEIVVDELSQKFSAVVGAGIDDRDKVDSVLAEPETDAAVQEVVPTVKRKLPEVKRFSARRSVVADDPKTKGNDESMAPSTIRRQRSAKKLSARMNTGIDDRDTVDYGSVTTEDPKPVVKNDTVKEAVSTTPKQQLSVAERERLRLLGIKRNKDIVCLERIRGKLVNITEGLELHTGVFSRVEQNKLIDLIKELQAKGRRQELKDRTYSEPRKWMRGKGRVTLQFGCCYNYAIDKYGNPPGILREDVVDPIPPLLRTTIKRLVRWHVLPPSCVPDSCIINIYEEGDCIPPHIDHHDFLRPFCTLSLLSECNIVFGANLEILGPGDFGGNTSLPLPMGSVLVLNGNGANVAKHAVPAVPTNRMSITFRKMDPSKVPVGFTLDEELQNLKPVSLPS